MGTPKNQSVMKAFGLLHVFRRPDEWLTSSELSRRAQLPEASGYRLLQTLEGLGAVVRDSRGRYHPGMLMLTLSQEIVESDLWREAPQELLNGLARRLDMAVQIGVLEDGMVTYVAGAGKGRPGLPVRIGAQAEPYCTAIGKTLLAALSDEELKAFLADGELVPLTAQTIVHPGELREALVRARADGFAVDDRESLDTLRCLAAPVRNAAGVTVAAISISEASDRLNFSHLDDLRTILNDAADAVSARLYPWAKPGPTGVGGTPALNQLACAGQW